MATHTAAESPSVYAPVSADHQGRADCGFTPEYGLVCLAPVRYAVAKRSLDVLLSALALVCLAPILGLVGLLVRCTSPGPAVFRQTRVGKGGRHFTLYKFRTMYTGAEASREAILHLNEVSGPVFKVRNDPRVTPIGRLLRKFSIDELPQFVNVLRGDMSLVGPRPPLPSEVRLYGPREKRRLAVQQGLTCLWQVHGRHDIPFDRWVEMDILYISTMTFWGDMALLLKTIPAVVVARGSY
jgi:lipopolysaccharide/colanic/teichoic acid biosynthesis glycosyltransferase